MRSVALLLFLAVYVFGQCFDPSCSNCTGGPTLCTACGGGKSLDFKGYCVSCITGFYFNTTTKTCATCSGNKCIACDANNTCQACDTYYGLKNAACTDCPTHATSCMYNAASGTMVALSCDGGYYLSNGQCVGCPAIANCRYCLDSTSCAICNDGYGRNSTFKCEACPANCQSCSTNNYCNTCKTGYARVSGQCVGNTCNSDLCKSFGQYVNPQVDGTTCFGGCDASSCCLGVLSGYVGYYQYQRTGTSNCGSLRQLETFKPDACYFSDIISTSLNSHCTDSNTSFQATEYFTDDCTGPVGVSLDVMTDTCVADPATGSRFAIFSCPNRRCSTSIYCLQCTNDTCGMCTPGYFPSGNTCNQCSSHCSSCTDANTCTQCNGGYYLSSGSCTACSTLTNCKYCANANSCATCNDGYYADANGTCVACIQNCEYCFSDTLCFSCKDGYSFNLVNNTCVAYAPHAISQTYDASGNIIIQACESGYYVNTAQTACLACPNGCATCSDRPGGVWCSACPSGQGFVNQPQMCASCSSNLNCRTCLSYAYDNKNGCMNCNFGYYLGTDHACHSGAAAIKPAFAIAIVLALVALFSA